MRAAARPALRLAACAALGLAASAAWAAIPSAARIQRAVAEQNRDAGRDRATAFDVALRMPGQDAPAATGELWVDPDGLARLELRRPDGVTERHLLRGGRVAAARDGEPVPAPRPFLPPLYLIQAPSADVLATGVRTLGGRSGEVELGYAGDHDCYVLGGRGPGTGSLWVDQETLDPVRIQRADGVHFELGPLPAPDASPRWPAWVEVREPGSLPVRLELREARPVRPSPEAFRPAWLAERPARAPLP